MKNTKLSFYFIAMLLLYALNSSNAQKFEGTLTYNIHYIDLSKVVKAKDLEIQYGNREIVSIKNGNYKSERLNDVNILKTTIFDNNGLIIYMQPNLTDYWIKDKINNDNAKKIIKLDTTATVGDFPCEVFRFVKTALKVTFFISKKQFAGKNNDNAWYNYPTPFQGPVVKLQVQSPDYTLVQELVSVDTKPLDDKIFMTGDATIVIPSDEISNQIMAPEKRKELQKCLNKSIGYPNFLDISKTEGKIVVDLLIDNRGEVKNTAIRTEYFKKQEESIRIYNTQKVKSIEQKIQRKILPLVQQCVAGYKFEAPVSGGEKVNTLLRIPFIFSKYVADVVEQDLDLDDQEIDEIYYDDFDQFY